jgi:FMN hydrolase / 5-amino-6-(5-phospho-D-ribitylamino)uracil phosphatase
MEVLRSIRAITMDLDDTLWPVWPVIERAEQRLHAWLTEHAPATARTHDTAALRRVRDEFALERPDLMHDLSAIRRESIRRALRASGDKPGLADAAFEVFFAARQDVQLFDDALPVLASLSRRLPLFALTNGNADIDRAGVGFAFVGSLSAREAGHGKPNKPIFLAACKALKCTPAEVLHVGDDWLMDVQGALNTGMPACWLNRAGLARPAGSPPTLEVRDLRGLLRAVVDPNKSPERIK